MKNNIFLTFLLLLSMALPVNAQNCEIICPSDAICIPNPLKHCMFDDFLYAMIDLIFWMATILFPLAIIISGLYFVTSGGNPDKVAKAKKIIFNALIGYIIILLSKGLVSAIRGILRV